MRLLVNWPGKFEIALVLYQNLSVLARRRLLLLDVEDTGSEDTHGASTPHEATFIL